MRMVYDEKLAQAAYLLGCQRTGEAIVIDPERDVDRYIELAARHELTIVAVAETHIHADFLSGARELAERIGARVYLSHEGGPDWTYQWLDQRTDGGTYDHVLLHDGDAFTVGNIQFKVMHTPGHTPEHIAYLVTDLGSGATEPIGLITGDFVFVGDLGRPDLLETAAGQQGAMEPSARRLFHTVDRLDPLPDFVQVWPAHGAGSACGKALGAVPMSTIGYEKRFNPALQAATSEREFIDFILTGQPEPPMYFATMKRLNKVGPPVLGGLPTPTQLTVDDLLALNPQQVAIIDARPWDEFRAGHIPDTLAIPMSHTFNSDAGSFLGEQDEIYLIIDPDNLDEALRDLIRVGLDQVCGWVDANELRARTDLASRLRTIPEVTVEEALQLAESPDVQVLDVRRATEFAEGHIPHAINVAHTRIASRLDEVPGDHRLLVNCRTGWRSARTSAYLRRLGFDVTNLQGGMLAWEAAHAMA
ncbi:MAG: MBL fold metallo-hydrolase [Planctomycetota bacterium]